MRLKEFIIFIIIFTIIYFLGFYIYDSIVNKKASEKRDKEVKDTINIEKYKIFCNFYNVTPSIDKSILEAIHVTLKQSLNNDLNQLVSAYSISMNELIVAILFLEYIGIIKTRKILVENNCCVPLKESDEVLMMKYSLMFSNKFDYDTVTKRIGLNSDKELLYMSTHYMMPGVILKDKILYYVGDIDE